MLSCSDLSYTDKYVCDYTPAYTIPNEENALRLQEMWQVHFEKHDV